MSTGMVYRNDSGGALARPDDMQWPRYDVLGAEAQDADGNLLDGAVVSLQGINSVDDLFGSSPTFISYIADGDLTRVYNGVDVPAAVPLSIEDKVYAPFDGERYVRQAGYWTQLRVDADNRQNARNLNPAIYADGASGEADPNGLAGWYFNNDANEKINWYFFSSINPAAPTLSEFGGCYFVLNIKASGAHTFVNVYTQPQGDGQDFSWYRSRLNYDDNAAMSSLPVGRYLVHTENLDVTGIYPDLDRITLPYDATFSRGPQNGSEKLFLIALSTGSGLSAGQNQITVENFAIRTRKLINRYDLLADPAQQAAPAGTFRGEVANDAQLSSLTNPLEDDYAGVQSTGTIWQYDGAAWADTNNVIAFQSWIPTVGTTEIPVENQGQVNISTAFSANVAQNTETGEVYRIGPTNQAYNVSGMASVETISAAGDYFEFPALLINAHTGLGLASTADAEGTGPNQNGVADPGVLWDYPTYNKSYTGKTAMAFFTGSGPWTYGSQNGGSYTTGSGYNSTTLRNLGLFPNYGGGGGATVRVGLDDQYHFYCSVIDGAVNRIVFRSLNPLPVQAYRFVCALYMGNAKLSQLPNRIVGAQPPANGYADTHYVDFDGFNEYVSFTDSTPIAGVMDLSQDWSFGFKIADTWNPTNAASVKYTIVKNGANTFYINANNSNASPYMANGQTYQGLNTWRGVAAGDRIVVCYNSSTNAFTYWLNGTSRGTRTLTMNNLADGTVTLAQGSGPGVYQSNYLAGGLDEVWFANRPLNVAEVQETVNGGDPSLWSFYSDVIEFLLMGEDVFPNIDGLKNQLTGTAENGEAEDFVGY